MTPGERVSEALARLEIEPEELAAEIGASPSALRRLAAGLVPPHPGLFPYQRMIEELGLPRSLEEEAAKLWATYWNKDRKKSGGGGR